MTALVPLPILLPLIGAAVSILLGRNRVAQRIVGLSVLSVNAVLASVLLVKVDADGPLIVNAGGWRAPVGVTLVADRFAVLMLTVGSFMLLAVLVYAIGQPGAERHHVGFQSVYLVLAAGVSASFLTGDLFNLFVAFEMMLTASYVLITLGGKREQVRAGMTYVVISLLASSLFLTALALIYSSTGTVNMADLSVQIAELSPGLRSGLAVLLLLVFGIKAALFPLYFWLPDAYPTAPSPVTAVFAGLLTKVGVYAIIRTQTLLFPQDTRPITLLLVLAGLTMVFGALGAIAQGEVKRILSFNIISHIGSMVMGLAFFTLAGVAATLYYVVHHIVAKTSLFLTGGLIEHVGGSSKLVRLGGMVRTAPLLAVLYLTSALSLAGVPPFSGFIGKVGLVSAGLDADRHVIVAVTLLVGLLSLFSLLKIWSGVFWNPADEPPEHAPREVGRLGGPVLMVAPTIAITALGVALALAAGPVYALCQRAAADLLDPSSYLGVVLP